MRMIGERKRINMRTRKFNKINIINITLKAERRKNLNNWTKTRWISFQKRFDKPSQFWTKNWPNDSKFWNKN